ncbi:hypothetical protein ABMX90_22820 [Vibrio vulnificus]|uniref:hypothetical protein n=1 Tax=Vibrio vulnificus TaxID=672 RepID=UPI0040583063|nr:hypothetical protein [Vibrio vulnificus]
MRKEEINDELTNLAFDFFYWFSRFEFALKENRVLKKDESGSNAEPGWDKFVEKYADSFTVSADSQKLIDLNPQRQIVVDNQELEWKPVGRADCKSELCLVVRLLKTIRNNLFHGGKHGAKGWDDPERTEELLTSGKNVLDQFAKMADWEADYTQYY